MIHSENQMTNHDRFEDLRDTIINNARFPEAVKVLRIDTAGGSYFTFHATGVDTGQAYSPVLTGAEIEGLKPQSDQRSALAGDATRFKLATEAHRIRMAHLYDPLFAVSVSKIDPLPHQLEAVYEYMLPQPALRALIAMWVKDPWAKNQLRAGRNGIMVWKR